MGCEVSNPSEILISHKKEIIWNRIASTEGMRPLMIEIQALVSTAVEHQQRSTTGYNAKRLNMILAVLEKELVLGWRQDVFLNITGGISVDDPAIDLAVVAAYPRMNIAVNKDFVLLAKWDSQVKFVP
jgi:DNA repair protein RadA/Sms